MSPTRLSGGALRVVRQLAESPPSRWLVRAIALKDHRIDELMALPSDARRPFDVEPRPLQGAAPRQWNDASLGTPLPRGHRRGSRQLVEAYRTRKTTPTEVLQRLIARIESGAFGAATHSPFVALDFDRARTEAAHSTQRYAEGRALGPLDGVPLPIKDQHDLAGFPTRFGTRYRTALAREDAFMVRTLRNAGALIYGKTHTTEWGMTPTGHNPHFAMPRNVYAEDRAAGGSSTGSAVATALGLCTLSSGTDGGGSIRIPSALNGVFGLKPTFGRVSKTGDIAGGSVGHTGPIGQSVGDLVDFMLAACVHRDPDDPLTTYAPDLPGVAEAWARAPGRGVRGCTIGVVRREWRDAPQDIAAAGLAALAQLEREGARLVDVEVPYLEHAPAMGVLAIGPECYGALEEDIARYRDLFSDDFRVSLAVLSTLSVDEIFAAMNSRAQLRRAAAAVLRRVDVLALPTLGCSAPSYPRSEDGVAVSDTASLIGLCRFAFFGNLTGLPAGTVPVGRGGDDIPIGLQIVGDAWDEASVLAVMAQLERAGLTDLPAPRGYFDLLG